MSSLLFGNDTDIIHWKPNPNSRGTFDILTTCLITLLLCVWTAVHLNISPPGSFWRPFWRKVGWLILALLAPEVVAYTAWCQRKEALKIMRMVNDAYGWPNPTPWYTTALQSMKNGTAKLGRSLRWQTPKPLRQPTLEAQKAASPSNGHPWTMAHGFYVAMGGLAFSIPADLPKSKSEQFVPSWACGTWFIMRTGLGSLLKMDMDRMPSLSEEEIKSKSKANGLAKALVCAQALWFLTTCVTRLAQRIPISLLELNTFGHAVCALFIYILWWEKPFEVDIPTIVHSKVLLDIYALAWVNTRGQSPLIRSMKSPYQDLLQANERFHALSKGLKKELSEQYPEKECDLFRSLDSFAILDAALFCLLFQRSPQGFPLVQDPVKSPARQPDLNGIPASTKFMPGEVIPDTGIKLQSTLDLDRSAFTGSGVHPALPSLNLTRQDINRWVMAKRAAELMHALPSSDSHIWRSKPFIRRCTDMPDFLDVLDELPLALGFSAAAMVYGGLHTLAWFAHFHSPTEQLLWRISSVVIMSGIPTLTAIYKIGRLLTSYHWGKKKILGLSFSVLLLLVTIAYILARLYLVIECFIQLSHLPAGVYDIPEWSSYFPHIA